MQEHLLSLFTGACYGYEQGPLCENGECFQEDGNSFALTLNCQLLAHIVLEEMNLPLPKYLRSLELYRRSCAGKVWVDKIREPDQARVGDLFLFSDKPVRHIQDTSLKYLHLAVCVGTQPLQCIHAHRWQKDGTFTIKGEAVSIWSLEDFCNSIKYNTLIGIRRVIQ